jgi:hypothetical protein
MEPEWLWEVVATNPSGHLRYHARLTTPNTGILLKTPDFITREEAYKAIRLARVHVLQAVVIDVDET